MPKRAFVGMLVLVAILGVKLTSAQTPTDEPPSHPLEPYFELESVCDFPCWWDIHPGETDAQTAIDIMTSPPYNFTLIGDDPIEERDSLGFENRIPESKRDEYGPAVYAYVSFVLENGIVERIHVWPRVLELSEPFWLTNILTEYGTPDVMRIFAYHVPDYGFMANHPFFYWRDLGMAISYSGFYEELCFQIGVNELVLHRPGEPLPLLTYLDATEGELPLITEISDLTNEEFTQILLDNEGCLPDDLPVD